MVVVLGYDWVVVFMVVVGVFINFWDVYGWIVFYWVVSFGKE